MAESKIYANQVLFQKTQTNRVLKGAQRIRLTREVDIDQLVAFGLSIWSTAQNMSKHLKIMLSFFRIITAHFYFFINTD